MNITGIIIQVPYPQGNFHLRVPDLEINYNDLTRMIAYQDSCQMTCPIEQAGEGGGK